MRTIKRGHIEWVDGQWVFLHATPKSYIDTLDLFAKSKIWTHYLVNTLALNIQFGGNPPYTLHEFVDPEKNVRVTDNGVDWKERGYAERFRIDLFGIYDYYWRCYESNRHNINWKQI